MNQDLRIAVVGVGYIGTLHARELSLGKVRGARLVATCDPSPEALARFPQVPRFSSSEALFESGSADAVLIATPHYEHTPLAIRALERGLHVLVEKPLAVHKADALRMIAAYERRPNPAQVFAEMLSLRIDPRFLKLRELIQSGALGPLRRINWISTDWFRTDAYYRGSAWRATWSGEGGGLLVNQSPHTLDAWQWLFGMPRRVHAFCDFGRYHQIEVEDQVTAYLAYEGGLSGVFVASTGEAPGTNRLEVVGDLGKAILGRRGIKLTRNETSMLTLLQQDPSANTKPPTQIEDFELSAGENARTQVIQNFVAAILEGEALIAPATEGLASVELANAMILSTLQQRTIDLPLDPALYAAELERLVAASSSAPRSEREP